MVRYNFLVLIISVLLAGCAVDLPVEYYISSSCFKNPDEAQAIIDAAEEWNKATCAEFLRLVGYVDDDWFTIEDWQDGEMVVYCVDHDENPDINKIIDEAPVKDIGGYSTADIFIKRDIVNLNAVYRHQNIYHFPETEPVSREYYLKVFKGVMVHELGHLFELGHNNEERGYSVMNPRSDSSMWYYVPTLLDIDGSNEIDGLCDLYNCPPSDTCPTRPVF